MYSRLFAHSSTSLLLPPSFSPQEEMQGPDGQPGYQHVLKLAKALLEARSLQGLSDKRVDELMALWGQATSRLPSQTPGEAAEGAVQDSEGEEHLLSWEGESPTVRLASNIPVSCTKYLLHINPHCPLCDSAVFSG